MNKPTSNSSGSTYTTIEPMMLPWLTTVLTWVSLAVQLIEQRDRVAGREVGDDLVGALGAGRRALQRQPDLLLTVVDLGAFDVAALI